MTSQTLLKLLVLIAASVALSVSAYASGWAGGTGNWSSNGNPGWNGTGVPNGVGAVANFPNATRAINVTAVAVPEPRSFALITLGPLLFFALRQRKRVQRGARYGSG